MISELGLQWLGEFAYFYARSGGRRVDSHRRSVAVLPIAKNGCARIGEGRIFILASQTCVFQMMHAQRGDLCQINLGIGIGVGNEVFRQ